MKGNNKRLSAALWRQPEPYLQAFGHYIVDNIPDIRLVYSHAKCNGGYDHLHQKGHLGPEQVPRSVIVTCQLQGKFSDE